MLPPRDLQYKDSEARFRPSVVASKVVTSATENEFWILEQQKDSNIPASLHDSISSSDSSILFSEDEDVPPRIPRRPRISFSQTVQVKEFSAIVVKDRLCKHPMTLSWETEREYSLSLDDEVLSGDQKSNRWSAGYHGASAETTSSPSFSSSSSNPKALAYWNPPPIRG